MQWYNIQLEYNHLKKELGLLQVQIISECYFFQLKKYEIQKNVTDKNTKFSALCVYLTHGLCEIFICNYMKTFLFNVLKMLRVHSFV